MELFIYANGFATAYFIIQSIYLWRRDDKRRIIRILSISYLLWAVMLIKDLWLAFPQHYTEDWLRAIAFADGLTVVSYAMILLELTSPSWVTARRVAWLAAPFPLFYLWAWMDGGEWSYYVYMVFIILYALTALGVATKWAQRYIRYVRQNYSYLKGVDISWVSYTFAFYITLQLVWLLITVVGSPVEDAIYYLMTVVFWELFLRKCLTLQPLSYKEMAEMVEEQNLRKHPLPSYYSFATNFERVMIEEQIYLRSDLKLGDLAKRFNTNRTYLSTYFTNVVKQTFYDYINGLRIEQKGIPLMKEHPEYSLDYVAEQSGFNSQSTFRRAFKKKTGQTPREFLSELGNDNER